jgi:hypothetical protein
MTIQELLAVLGFIPDDDFTSRDESHVATYNSKKLSAHLRLDLGLLGLDEHAGDVVDSILRENAR